MKKTFALFAMTLLLVPAAMKAQENIDANDKTKKKIEGSGNIITKEISVQPFDQLDASGVYNVLLTQGNNVGVKIEADDNLQDLFQVKNDGSKLVISMKKDVNFSSKKGLKVHVTFKDLKSMNLKMVGSLSSDGYLSFNDLVIANKSVGSVDLKMTAQKLNVENKSVGAVKLEGKVEDAVIRNKGVGSISAGGLVVQTMDIENNGVGSAEVNAVKELKVKDSFLGKVTNKGSAPVRRMNKVVI